MAERTRELADANARLQISEAQLTELAQHDPLTGLANRRRLTDALYEALNHTQEHPGEGALLLIDLDRFKPVNDGYGHEIGDRLLQEVALRLCRCAGPHDTVARLGGDEFVLIVESFNHPDELLPIGRKLIDAISEGIALPAGEVVNVGASVGFALYPHHGTDINDLLHVADKGMYDCKISGLMELH